MSLDKFLEIADANLFAAPLTFVFGGVALVLIMALIAEKITR